MKDAHLLAHYCALNTVVVASNKNEREDATVSNRFRIELTL